jgi:hypothetical protein
LLVANGSLRTGRFASPSTNQKVADLEAIQDDELRETERTFNKRLSAPEQKIRARDSNRFLAAAFNK